jgi:excisionase family DNA binding protein
MAPMATDTQETRYLSVAEVALRLGVSAHTVRRKVAEGQLKAVRLGEPPASIRISSRELEGWLRDNAVQGGDPA